MILCFNATTRSDQNFENGRKCDKKIKPRNLGVGRGREVKKCVIQSFEHKNSPMAKDNVWSKNPIKFYAFMLVACNLG